MYVCLCRRVTDRSVRAAIEAGACDVETVGRACGAGAGCGGCRALVHAMLQAAGRGNVERGWEGPVPATVNH